MSGSNIYEKKPQELLTEVELLKAIKRDLDHHGIAQSATSTQRVIELVNSINSQFNQLQDLIGYDEYAAGSLRKVWRVLDRIPSGLADEDDLIEADKEFIADMKQDYLSA